MYEYLDQPVSHLDHGGRFLIWSMRNWVQAMHDRHCPACVIGPAFVKWQIIPALAPFQAMMATLNLHARRDLSFAPCRCTQVSDDEALLLSLIAHAPNRSISALDASLSLTVHPTHVEGLRTSLSAIAGIMAEHGLLPGTPGPVERPAC